jgi:hypothetical protein
MPKHRKEVDRFPKQAPMLKACEDFVAANPGLPIRWEPFTANDDQPWPCVWPGCMEDTLEDACLCAMHEMRHIAKTGKRSPLARTIHEWNDHLTKRTQWLSHWNEK